MGKFLKAYHLNLQLFAEGAGGDGGASGVGASDGAQAAVAAQPSGSNTQQTAAEAAGDGAQVAAVQNGQEETQETPIDRDREFRRMIRGDYKEAFDRQVNRIVRERVRSTNEKVRGYDATAPIIDTLTARYGTEPGDYAALKAAIEADKTYRDVKAEEMGVTPEVYDELETLRSRAKAQDSARREAEAAMQYARHEQQIEETRKVYPRFDYDVAMKDTKFKQIVDAGVDVKTAYEICNRDRLMASTVRRTADLASRKAEENAVNRIRTRGMRPAENGANPQSASQTKIDVSKLSDDQIKEYLRRAKNGEKITF